MCITWKFFSDITHAIHFWPFAGQKRIVAAIVSFFRQKIYTERCECRRVKGGKTVLEKKGVSCTIWV